MGRKPKQQKQQETEPIIDLDSYDWGNEHLTRKEKMFIALYTTPGQKYFQDSTHAAMKAGYKTTTSYNIKYSLLSNPKITKLIDKFTQDVIKVSVQEYANKLIMQKIKRATYNIKDYYTTEEFTNKDGQTREITTMKPITELTPEQASVVDGISVNNIGIATVILPNREKEINEIIKLNDSLNKGGDANKFDVETTVDVVKENLATIKTTVMLRNQEIRENAGKYIETSDDLPEYD